jgi:hypothetical protein
MRSLSFTGYLSSSSARPAAVMAAGLAMVAVRAIANKAARNLNFMTHLAQARIARERFHPNLR